MFTITDLNRKLKSIYGYRGWWPVFSRRNTTGYDNSGYRFAQPLYPLPKSDRDEIVIGAVLTQNTNWLNVEKALLCLERSGCLSSRGIVSLDIDLLKENIRPSGFYNQKALRLKEIFRFLRGNPDPEREKLLDVNGVGPETADSILLYAFGKAHCVVDAYTLRILTRIGICMGSGDYHTVKALIEKELGSDIEVLQNFHALIVTLAKMHCRKTPDCIQCPLKDDCNRTGL